MVVLISSKQQFYQIQKLGLFNTPRYWDRLEDVDTDSTLTARNVKNPGSKTYYLKTLSQMKQIFRRVPQENYTFLENPPDGFRSIQGEFTRLNGNWYLKYNRSQGTLGESLPVDHTITTGAYAMRLLRDNLDGASFEDMMLITDMFGDRYNVETPVIEFSAYTIPIGQLRGRNTIIWEVRSY
jgi:hypothetical protein